MIKNTHSKPRNLWFERLMAVTATVNLGLVLFDLSYIPLRDFYLRNIPVITRTYDQIKGIEPHRETESYLAKVNTLQEEVIQTGLRSPQVTTHLQELSDLSVEMIDSNPFGAANKSGTLEKIKNQMRDRVGVESSKQAFNIFWSPEYLLKNGWGQEINFFNQRIRPLIATNYYRHIGENNELIDRFWIIDLPFMIIFGIELLARSSYIKRKHVGFSWFNAICWRWYDIFLLLPFWRWLRVIPVLIRLDQARLLDLQPIRQLIHEGFVANFAEEITEVVVVRVINQMQGAIQRGELTRLLSKRDNRRPYIDLNNVNEVEAIGTLLVQTIVYQVLPKIQPEVVAILRHNIETVLKQTPIYRNLQFVPGLRQVQTQLGEQLASQITSNLYSAIVKAIEDPVAGQLSSQLFQRFSESLGDEIQKQDVVTELQALLLDFLEEVKINYVQQMSSEEMQQILLQTKQLRMQARPVQPVVDESPNMIVRKTVN